MGIISNSFKRQVGRDTGKVVSNLLYGDRHASPHRIIHRNETKQEGSSERSYSRNDDDDTVLQYVGSDNEVDNRIDEWNEKEYIEKISTVLSIRFDDNPQDALTGLLSNLYVLGWHSGYSGMTGLKNKYSDVCLKKYREGILMLQAADNPLADFHIEEYGKLKRKRFFQKHKAALIIGGLILAIGISIGITAILDEIELGIGISVALLSAIMITQGRRMIRPIGWILLASALLFIITGLVLDDFENGAAAAGIIFMLGTAFAFIINYDNVKVKK